MTVVCLIAVRNILIFVSGDKEGGMFAVYSADLLL
jgi:hypothetical protein